MDVGGPEPAAGPLLTTVDSVVGAVDPVVTTGVDEPVDFCVVSVVPLAAPPAAVVLAAVVPAAVVLVELVAVLAVAGLPVAAVTGTVEAGGPELPDEEVTGCPTVGGAAAAGAVTVGVDAEEGPVPADRAGSAIRCSGGRLATNVRDAGIPAPASAWPAVIGPRPLAVEVQ